MQQLMSEPLWDEGLSSFLYGEYEKRQAPLELDDLRAFANEHAVRIGDILETLFLMNELYAKGRLTDKDLAAFSGMWQPV